MATPVRMTVSQLTCACTVPGWMARFHAGENPSTASFGGDGISQNSTQLHLLANHFVRWAVDPETAAEAAKLDSDEELYIRLQELGGTALTERLCRAGNVEQAARLSENMDRLAQHFLRIRRDYPGFARWGDLYLAKEYSIKKVPLRSTEYAELLVSGRMDAIRHLPGEPLVIVDYKLSAGQDPQKELVQLAIYHRLLKLHHKLDANGCMEYLWPELMSMPVTSAELETIYETLVEPKLQEFFGSAQGGKPVGQETPGSKAAATVKSTKDPSEVLLGALRDSSAGKVMLDRELFTRHTAVLGGTGSGKTTAAMNILEQILEAGLPVILLDRKGDLSRYGSEDAWVGAELQRFRNALEIDVYTPGASQGRSLRLPLFPCGLSELSPEDRNDAVENSANSFSQALGLTRASDGPKKALLLCVYQVLAKRHSGEIGIDDVLTLLSSEDVELSEAMGHLEKRHLKSLLQTIQTFGIMSRRLVDPAAELLNCEKLFSSIGGKTRLTIISTKFLGDDSITLFWVAQFFIEVLRYVSKTPSDRLQGILMIDEADIYLPAVRLPATKTPLQSLLRRARSGGVGLMLCTQSPGDLDYRGRDNIRTWLLGKISQARALTNLGALLTESKVAPETLSKQGIGEFVLTGDGVPTSIKSQRSKIETKQLSEDEILKAAANSKKTRDLAGPLVN